MGKQIKNTLTFMGKRFFSKMFFFKPKKNKNKCSNVLLNKYQFYRISILLTILTTLRNIFILDVKHCNDGIKV
ncbi:hypothetical protein BK764_20205 [Bacillus thuringiensis serovar israelensis]|uniref:Uncharacterized protein n=1 Tax=Bacillus thuringiensis HD-789 TaxID=1217737 RepID=A0A9W3JR64_BACTU|nr:hypothetical protein BTF1_10620 [Bacillus thuringiensis HD-789]AND24462.1 hypothetical protein ATN07_13100 [Bacillus thuringiensis serovar israelensis]KAA0794462.1 hypothetical protein DN406_13825 [Bacillus sp. BB56-3]KQB21588.1 hypothetical protein AL712_18700 [Bacillus thuringiensis]KRD94886.1 hypothetical protein ASE53_04900 [Bacillus sp. Root11]KRD98987.1 hypothetical protein ASE54_13910 [Bacillus sp. Root131]OJD98084.1 hypothetical protein A9485_25840 [Bacillus cereus]OTX65357.1 hypo